MKKNYLIFLLASMVIIFGSNFFVEQDVSQEKSSTNNNSIESNSEYQVSEDALVVIEDI